MRDENKLGTMILIGLGVVIFLGFVLMLFAFS